MWLINTSTLDLHEFIDAEHSPPYAILSHCWGEGELAFKDFRKKRNCFGPGYSKISDCCAFASNIPYEQYSWDNRAGPGFGKIPAVIQWVWIDTVCIDKKSSAELTEAINSMFRWYSFAQICFAHLADVVVTGRSPEEIGTQFRQSRWFTRGWTLQELIAPGDVIFVDRDWQVIGTKNQQFVDARRLSGMGPMTGVIASITQIPVDVLSGITRQNLALYSVAQRMSWAAKRYTTRAEDLAYCLLGIFGINMPLLYGEGRNAFRRLQEALLRGASDSVFAWRPRGEVVSGELREAGMLARSPAAFADAGSIVDVGASSGWFLSPKGSGFQLEVHVSNPVPMVFKHRVHGHFLVRLQCSRVGKEADKLEPCVMILRQTDCGHLQRAFDAGVFTEYDLLDPKQYEPQKDVKTLYVHATKQDHLHCKGRLARVAHRHSVDWPLSNALLPQS